MNRVCIALSFFINLFFGTFLGYLFWTVAASWLLGSVFLVTDATWYLWMWRFVVIVGVLATVSTYLQFWRWYFDIFQPLVTRHRILFGRNAPDFTEQSHTGRQIIFTFAYMLTYWFLSSCAFLFGIWCAVSLSHTLLGSGTLFIGGLIGLVVGIWFSNLSVDVVNRLFSIERLENEISMGLFSWFHRRGDTR
jgi:hypothetical protein